MNEKDIALIYHKIICLKVKMKLVCQNYHTVKNNLKMTVKNAISQLQVKIHLANALNATQLMAGSLIKINAFVI